MPKRAAVKGKGEARAPRRATRPKVTTPRATAPSADSVALAHANEELRSLTQNLDQLVRQRTRALAESEAQLRRKNAELDRLNRNKAEFIAIAAHELRTPMTSIVGYLDLVLEGKLGEVPAWLGRPMASVRRNSQRLKRLIDDLLDVSRLDMGQMPLRLQPCNLGELLDAVVAEFQPIAGARKQRVVPEVTTVDPIEADPDRLHQVLANLVTNAIKHGPEGGDVLVRLDGYEGRARLRVRDEGPGIPPHLHARIFDPFTDVKTAKHHTSSGLDSAGLGLSIARGIATLHGGTLSVASEPGVYTEFTVLLPFAQPKL